MNRYNNTSFHSTTWQNFKNTSSFLNGDSVRTTSSIPNTWTISKAGSFAIQIMPLKSTLNISLVDWAIFRISHTPKIYICSLDLWTDSKNCITQLDTSESVKIWSAWTRTGKWKCGWIQICRNATLLAAIFRMKWVISGDLKIYRNRWLMK